MRLQRVLDLVLDRVTILVLVVLVLVVGAQVFARYVLNHSLFWSEELARYLFIYVVFLGATIALRHGQHIQVSFFADRLPSALRWADAILVDLLLLAFTGTVFWQSVRLAGVVWTVPMVSLPLPWTFVYLGILLGMGTMTVGILNSLWRRLRGEQEEKQ